MPDAELNDTLDYDALERWGPWVGTIVANMAGRDLVDELGNTSPAYIEDARDWFFARTGRDQALAAVAQGLRGRSVRLYHGTRLSAAAVAAVRECGLRPLSLIERQDALVSALSGHPRWAEVESKLAKALERFGREARAGRREDGCVHVCFSREGLLRGCNHYLTHGAEVDGHIAHHLFGDDSGHRLLRDTRQPFIIAFEVPFDIAAQGSHSLGDLEVGRGLLAEKLIGAWSYWIAHPEFRTDTQRDCTAAKIPGVVGSDRLIIEPVEAAELGID